MNAQPDAKRCSGCLRVSRDVRRVALSIDGVPVVYREFCTGCQTAARDALERAEWGKRT